MTTALEVPIMQSDKPTKEDEKKVVSHRDVQEAVTEFAGEVADLHKIDANKLFNDNYRVNVWTKKLNEGGLSFSYEIERSYFMHYADGVLTDLTREPKERSLGKFF